MLSERRVAVVVPAYREERLIATTIRGVPDYVDSIFIVDDKSDDGTVQAVLKENNARVKLLCHSKNRGVGAAIVTGYRAAAEEHDVLAVMAGDNQMHPDDLRAVLEPLLSDQADYVKGNRFVHPDVRRMPFLRRLGGKILSWATRLATGLDVGDCQCGFTAISRRTIHALPLEELWPRFGYPNDLLGMLAARGFRVREVPVRPVYADERSGVRAIHVILILALIARRRVSEGRRLARASAPAE